VIDDTLERGHGELGQGTSSIEDVLHHVREGMRQGRLVPGQRLAEPDLMQRLSVSRGTVREALVHLRAEGLVELERYRGARIRILSRRKVIELNQIRGVVEGLAARLVAEGAGQGGQAAAHRHPRALRQGQRRLSRLHNERFHNTIIELSGNVSLRPVIAATLLETFRVQFHPLLSRPEATRRSYKEHTDILRAILKRDAEEAERRMTHHIEGSCREILDAPDHYFI